MWQLELKSRLGVGDNRWIISIEGPGGIGKSSLAFQIARWASDSRADYRLARFPMLSVLVESARTSADVPKTIDDTAEEKLRLIMDAPTISAPLLQALLRRKRVLVVVDGVSEMPKEAADTAIRPEKGAVDTRALVVTSRLPTNLSGSLVIRPQALTLAFLDRVLDDLIAVNVGSGRFSGDDREKLRTRVKALMEDARDGAEERQVPMIFLKLMIQRADELLNESMRLDELPRTLSELVTAYTEQLLRSEPDLSLAVKQAWKVAQVCMGKERRPASRSESRYIAAGLARETLDNFATAGLMVRSGDQGDPFFKFALDPVAEQLDVSRLVVDIRDEKADKNELDDLVERWEGLPDDFIRALRRAAENYRQKICAAHSALSSKLWPEEVGTPEVQTQGKGMRSLEDV